MTGTKNPENAGVAAGLGLAGIATALLLILLIVTHKGGTGDIPERVEHTVPAYEVTCDAFETDEIVCVDQDGRRWTKNAATIGSSVVSGLECQEDEVIAYVQEGPAPYSLGCVNGDAIYEKG